MSSKPRAAARLTVRRGLGEVEAAAYLSLSSTFFRRLLRDGVMPRPRIAGRRKLWDIEELDDAFLALPREGEEAVGADGNTWSNYE